MILGGIVRLRVGSLGRMRTLAVPFRPTRLGTWREFVIRIAIAGHRRFRDARTTAFVARTSLCVLQDVHRKHSDVRAVSALAEGADTLFAEAALTLGIPLDVVRPFDRYEGDFAPGRARDRYNRLRRAARAEEVLPYRDRSNQAYTAAMRWVVNLSDVLVAAWDGRPAASPAGTGHAVRHALSTGRDVIHLDVAALSVTRRAAPT